MTTCIFILFFLISFVFIVFFRIEAIRWDIFGFSSLFSFLTLCDNISKGEAEKISTFKSHFFVNMLVLFFFFHSFIHYFLFNNAMWAILLAVRALSSIFVFNLFFFNILTPQHLAIVALTTNILAPPDSIICTSSSSAQRSKPNFIKIFINIPHKFYENFHLSTLEVKHIFQNKIWIEF